jgi:RES domain-containing protein
VAHVWSGEGARLYGGRWNEPGTAVVYLSEHLSLAALEVLVHLDPSDAPDGWTAWSAEVPDADITWLPAADLPPDWRTEAVPGACAALGTAWAAELRSPVLAVPSALVPREHNLVLNPRHPDAARVARGAPEGFAFDPRLLP